MMQRATGLFVLFSALTLAMSQPAVASDDKPAVSTGKPNPAINMKGATRPRLPYIRDKYVFQRDILKKEPSLTDVPSCPDCHFLTGTCAPKAQGGSVYTLIYASKLSPQQTVSWFQNALQQLKWSVNSSKPVSLSATKSGDCLQLFASGSSRKNTGCELLVNYRYNH